MSTQQIFAQEPQAPFGFAENPQPAIAFPVTLAEKYQPRQLSELIGIPGPRRLLDSLVREPRPCAMLFVGNPGVGKTVAGLCFADTLGASLVHISAQKCDVATLDSLRDRFAYHPPKGKFWVCLVDEADQMTEKAQVQLLSRLDATASLVTGFGGASSRQSQPPIIWIFTANGTGKNGTTPPSSLEKRFLSRCMVIPFEPLTDEALSEYLVSVWTQEAPDFDVDREYFNYLARGGGIRESLMKLQVDILTGAPRPVPPVEEPEPEVKMQPRQPRPDKAPAPARSPGWRRIYGGANDRVDRIKRHLLAHKIESLVRDVATGNRPGARKSISVKIDNYQRAMTLVARMKA
jgi:hypothetical protein